MARLTPSWSRPPMPRAPARPRILPLPSSLLADRPREAAAARDQREPAIRLQRSFRLSASACLLSASRGDERVRHELCGRTLMATRVCTSSADAAAFGIGLQGADELPYDAVERCVLEERPTVKRKKRRRRRKAARHRRSPSLRSRSSGEQPSAREPSSRRARSCTQGLRSRNPTHPRERPDMAARRSWFTFSSSRIRRRELSERVAVVVLAGSGPSTVSGDRLRHKG